MPDLPRWVRPSNLPRLAVCPASGVESEGCASAASDKSALGNAWHEVAAWWIRESREVAEVQIPRIAERWAVDAETLRGWLAGLTWEPTQECWSEFEVCIDLGDGLVMTGTADVVLSHDDGSVEVVDWKTGDPDYITDWLQIEAYVLGAAASWLKRGRGTICAVQLGDEGWDSREVDIEAARERIRGIVALALAQRDLPLDQRSYRVSDACQWCPARSKPCPALWKEMALVPALIETGGEIAIDSPDRALWLHERSGLAMKALMTLRDVLKIYVEEQGGEVEGENGKLVLQDVPIREHTVKAHVQRRLVRKKA